MLADPTDALGRGLAEIRTEFQVPAAFAPDVIAAADAASRREPDEHVDRTSLPFATLDPATSTDLDQASSLRPAVAPCCSATRSPT